MILSRITRIYHLSFRFLSLEYKNMKKTLILLLLFLVIGGFTYYLSTKKDTKTTLLTTARNFAVADIDQVQKIFIADRNGKNVTLERQKNYWQLNGKHRANPNSVSILLNTIQKLKIKYTPSRKAIKNIINDIATNNRGRRTFCDLYTRI